MLFFYNSWFRKKHPKTLEYVAPPPLPDTDCPLRSMTVVQYLEELHRCPTPSDIAEQDEDHVTTEIHSGIDTDTAKHGKL